MGMQLELVGGYNLYSLSKARFIRFVDSMSSIPTNIGSIPEYTNDTLVELLNKRNIVSLEKNTTYH